MPAPGTNPGWAATGLRGNEQCCSESCRRDPSPDLGQGHEDLEVAQGSPLAQRHQTTRAGAQPAQDHRCAYACIRTLGCLLRGPCPPKVTPVPKAIPLQMWSTRGYDPQGPVRAPWCPPWIQAGAQLVPHPQHHGTWPASSSPSWVSLTLSMASSPAGGGPCLSTLPVTPRVSGTL